jgi:hypothetical protein
MQFYIYYFVYRPIFYNLNNLYVSMFVYVLSGLMYLYWYCFGFETR